MKVIRYQKEMDIRNLEALPKGTGCSYLEVVETHVPNVYIAKQWRRGIGDNSSRIIVAFR